MLTRSHRLARRAGRPLAGMLGWGYVNECGTDFWGTKYFALYGADGSFQECVDGDTIGQQCPPGYGPQPGNGERVCVQKTTAPDAGQPCEFVGTENGESWWFKGIKDSDGNCTNPVRGERYFEEGEQPQPVETYTPQPDETYTPPPSDDGLSCGGEVATGVYSSRIVNGECVPCGDGLGWNEWSQACEPVVSDIPAAPPDERPRPPDGGSYTPRPSSPIPRPSPPPPAAALSPRTLVLGLAALGLAAALYWKRKKRR